MKQRNLHYIRKVKEGKLTHETNDSAKEGTRVVQNVLRGAVFLIDQRVEQQPTLVHKHDNQIVLLDERRAAKNLVFERIAVVPSRVQTQIGDNAHEREVGDADLTDDHESHDIGEP